MRDKTAALERAARSGDTAPGGNRAVLARRVAVWAAAATYAGFFSLASGLRHQTFSSGTYDLAFMDQAMWNTLRGHLLGVSIEPWLATSELGYHFEPILFLIVPLYALYESPHTLLVLQSIVLASGALPASWLAYHRLRSNLAAVVFAVAYLMFPGLQAANMFDFHPFALSSAFLLFAFYFMERGRYGAFALAAVLAMGTKENVPLTVVMLGLYLLAVKREWRPGLATVAAGLVWFLFATYVAIPAYSSQGQGWLWNRYGGMGGAPWEIVFFLLANPERFIEPAPGLSNLDYLARLLFPVAFLSLLHPPTLVLAVPGLATNLLTVYEAMHFLETYHYTSSLVPIVVISAIYGTGVLADAAARVPRLSRRMVIWSLCVLVATTSLVYHYYRGYTPLSPSFSWEWPSERHAVGQRLAASIPPEASVAAQSNLGPHVSRRRQLTMFPNLADAEYVFLDVASQPNSLGFDEGVHLAFRQMVDREDYGIVAADSGFLLLRQGEPRRDLPPAFYSFARAGDSTPDYPLSIRFGDELELLGFDLHPARDARCDLTLYWRSLRPQDEPWLLAVYLTDGQGQELGAAAHPQPANFWYPVPLWEPGEVVQVRTLRLPWDPGGDDYGLAVGVVAGDDPWVVERRLLPQVAAADWLVAASGGGTLAEIVTLRNDRGLVRPEWIDRPVAVEGEEPLAFFGDRVELVGVEQVGEASAGGTARVRLNWRVVERCEGAYTVFVHVLAPGPTLAAQRDSPPLSSRLPTTFWLPGDGIADEYQIPLPSDLTPGVYDLAVGLYDPLTGVRLPARLAEGQLTDQLLLPGGLVVSQR